MKNLINADKFDAVLFDLDGVLTPTEKIHSACWKRMFDEFLEQLAVETCEEYIPFDIERDYLQYVDGKPRYQGVRDFLKSRDIDLPDGTSDSPPDEKSICGLGNKKNELFNLAITREPVEFYESSIDFVKKLKKMGIKLAVVSSSRNCKQILLAAGIGHFFDLTIDGVFASNLKLRGKPMPDTFLEASKRLGVIPKRTVIVEDAISGVEAGRNGNFGLVIGIARKGNFNELKKSGADKVVNDLGELLR